MCAYKCGGNSMMTHPYPHPLNHLVYIWSDAGAIHVVLVPQLEHHGIMLCPALICANKCGENSMMTHQYPLHSHII